MVAILKNTKKLRKLPLELGFSRDPKPLSKEKPLRTQWVSKSTSCKMHARNNIVTDIWYPVKYTYVVSLIRKPSLNLNSHLRLRAMAVHDWNAAVVSQKRYSAARLRIKHKYACTESRVGRKDIAGLLLRTILHFWSSTICSSNKAWRAGSCFRTVNSTWTWTLAKLVKCFLKQTSSE